MEAEGAGKPPDDDDFPIFSSSSSEEENCDVETELRKTINLTSKSYNPLLALNCKDVILPGCEKTATYHTVKDFKKHIPDLAKPKKKIKTASPAAVFTPVPATKPSQEAQASTSLQQSEQVNYPIPGRRFLPHQLPVHRPRKEHPNVITMMSNVEGPLAALNKVRLSRGRIKVWIKNNVGIRGYCTANLEAFDKHWNLLLTNVNEKFQRKRHLKTPASLSIDADELTSFRTGQLFTEFQTQRKLKETSKPIPGEKSTKEEDDSVKIERGLRTLRLADNFDSGTVTMFQKGLSSYIPRRGQPEDDTLSKSQLRKKRLVILDKPIRDFHGNTIIAQSQNYEIVHRRVAQLLLLGDSVVFIETEPS